MQVRLLINSIDLTAHLFQDWDIQKSDQDDIDVVQISLNDEANNLVINRGRDVIIEKWSDANTRHFGGIVAEIVKTPLGLGRRIDITCQDWKILLDRMTFSKRYTNKTDQFIIQNAFTETGLTEIDTTDVASTRTIDFIRFTGHSLRSMLDQISQITGAKWSLDSKKKLHYKPEGTIAASFSLSDNPDEVTSWPYYNSQYVEELGNYNEVEVRGGVALSDNITETMSGDGVRKVWVMGGDDKAGGGISEPISKEPTRAYIDSVDPTLPERVVIHRNTGTDGSPTWTVQSVGLDQGQTGFGTYAVLWNPAERRVQWNTTPPNFTNSWRITGRRFMPIVVRLPDLAAQSESGRVFRQSIHEPSVETLNMAQDIAIAALRENKNRERLTVQLNQEGLEVGEYVTVTASRYGLQNQALRIHNLNLHLLGSTLAEYRVTLGGGSHTLAHLLFALRQKAAQPRDEDSSAVTLMRMFFKVVELKQGYGSRAVGATYYIMASDGTPAYDLAAVLDLATSQPLVAPFQDLEWGDWPLAVFTSGSGRRGVATVMLADFCKAQ